MLPEYIYSLFLPARTSHILQPLDLGCFSSLKAAYRRLVSEYIARTDTTKVGKANFLEFYAKARENRSSGGKHSIWMEGDSSEGEKYGAKGHGRGRGE